MYFWAEWAIFGSHPTLPSHPLHAALLLSSCAIGVFGHLHGIAAKKSRRRMQIHPALPLPPPSQQMNIKVTIGLVKWEEDIQA